MACCAAGKDVEAPPAAITESTPLTAPSPPPPPPENPMWASIFFILGSVAYASYLRSYERDVTMIMATVSVLYLQYFLSLPSPYHTPDAAKPLRMDRIACNQMENLPIALVVLWAVWSVGTNLDTLAILFAVFLGLRIGFALAYLFGLQPWRTVFWMGSQFTMMVVIGYGCYASQHKTEQFVPMVLTGSLYVMHLALLVLTINKGAHPAEDAGYGIDDAAKAAYLDECSKGPTRLERCCKNSQEQVPFNLLILWAASNCGADAHVMMMLFVTYTAGRFLFVLLYVLALQPFRFVAFYVSFGSVIAAAYYGICADMHDMRALFLAITCTMFVMQHVLLTLTADATAHPPEDKFIVGMFDDAAKAAYKASRANGPTLLDRVAENQLHNFVMALIVMWYALSVDANKELMAILFVGYLILQALYLATFMCGQSVWRAVLYVMGFLCVVCAVILGFSALFKSPLNKMAVF